jgi:sigma-54 dependent transcriptional regulator, acetoin dehydrogenase operon transcriptional activator AcoR
MAALRTGQREDMTQLSTTPFFPTRAERVELARRRYFEEGLPPSGVVSDAVFQSWARCQRLRQEPKHRVAFQHVTASRMHQTLRKNHHLHDAWIAELPQIEAALGTTSSAALLTDATGVLIGSACVGRAHERLMLVANRVGVDLSEEAIGTTAPGVVVRTRQPLTVLGNEHFFDEIGIMHCAAAPIRDVQGNLAGVLDVSSESIPFNFDAAAVVGLFAGAIENRLLVAHAREHLVVRLQVMASLLDSPLVGIVGIDGAGRVAWCNGVAARLVGAPWAGPRPGPPPAGIKELGSGPSFLEGVPPIEQSVRGAPLAEVVLGAGVARLASLPKTGAATLELPNGLKVGARAEMRAPDGHRGLIPAARVNGMEPAHSRANAPDAAPTTLRESNRDLIERTLRECNGNVSRAARKLGVSRGVIYRRLRGDETPGE